MGKHNELAAEGRSRVLHCSMWCSGLQCLQCGLLWWWESCLPDRRLARQTAQCCIKEHAMCTTPIRGAWTMCSLNILIELPKQTVSNTQCLLHTAVQYSLVLIIGIACHIRVMWSGYFLHNWWMCRWTQCKRRKTHNWKVHSVFAPAAIVEVKWAYNEKYYRKLWARQGPVNNWCLWASRYP